MRGSIWISLGVVVLFVASFCSFLVIRALRKMVPPEEVLHRNRSPLISITLKHWWFWQSEPFVRFLVRLGLNPNSLTVIGFFLSVLAALLFSGGWFAYAGFMLLLGSTFDMFDGTVARLTGQSSRSGAFFDSVMDRFSEGILFLGLGYYFRDSWWMLAVVFAGLIGSMMVSYTRARGEGVGVKVSMGIMQRPERIVCLGISALFEPIVHQWLALTVDSPVVVMTALFFIAVMALATSFSRMIYVMRILEHENHP